MYSNGPQRKKKLAFNQFRSVNITFTIGYIINLKKNLTKTFENQLPRTTLEKQNKIEICQNVTFEKNTSHIFEVRRYLFITRGVRVRNSLLFPPIFLLYSLRPHTLSLHSGKRQFYIFRIV